MARPSLLIPDHFRLEQSAKTLPGMMKRMLNVSYLWCRIDAELELCLLSILNRETLHEKCCEATACTASE